MAVGQVGWDVRESLYCALTTKLFSFFSFMISDSFLHEADNRFSVLTNDSVYIFVALSEL